MWWTLCPAGMTFDSGKDLLLGYSDERLCLPSDNCSLRGRERSINQNELRYHRTPLPMAERSLLQQPPWGKPGSFGFKGIKLVRSLSFYNNSHWRCLAVCDLTY